MKHTVLQFLLVHKKDGAELRHKGIIDQIDQCLDIINHSICLPTWIDCQNIYIYKVRKVHTMYEKKCSEIELSGIYTMTKIGTLIVSIFQQVSIYQSMQLKVHRRFTSLCKIQQEHTVLVKNLE